MGKLALVCLCVCLSLSLYLSLSLSLNSGRCKRKPLQPFCCAHLQAELEASKRSARVAELEAERGACQEANELGDSDTVAQEIQEKAPENLHLSPVKLGRFEEELLGVLVAKAKLEVQEIQLRRAVNEENLKVARGIQPRKFRGGEGTAELSKNNCSSIMVQAPDYCWTQVHKNSEYLGSKLCLVKTELLLPCP